MKAMFVLVQVYAVSLCYAQANQSQLQLEAEYYVSAYSQHYRVPIALARAIIKQESDWQPCAISSKGAAGLMQLMPKTATRLGVANRCRIDQNVSGGIRYIAWLMPQFHNDFRLVCAAYYVRRGRDCRA